MTGFHSTKEVSKAVHAIRVFLEAGGVSIPLRKFPRDLPVGVGDLDTPVSIPLRKFPRLVSSSIRGYDHMFPFH